MSGFGNEVQMASQIAAQLVAAGVDEDDPHFEMLMASETDMLNRLQRIVRASRFAQADAKALGEMIAEMRERKARLERKAESLRDTAAWALSELNLSKLQAPDFTATIAPGRPKVVITEEAALPNNVCRLKREPDKSAIAEMLGAGFPVPGAEMSNGSPSLTVRVR